MAAGGPFRAGKEIFAVFTGSLALERMLAALDDPARSDSSRPSAPSAPSGR